MQNDTFEIQRQQIKFDYCDEAIEISSLNFVFNSSQDGISGT